MRLMFCTAIATAGKPPLGMRPAWSRSAPAVSRVVGMTTSRLRTLGLAALAVAGLSDILDALLTITVGDDGDRPPSGVLVALFISGVVAFAGYLGRGGLI